MKIDNEKPRSPTVAVNVRRVGATRSVITKECVMGYLMKEVETLTDKDVTPELREVLLHLASVLEDTESKASEVDAIATNVEPK